MPDPLLRPVQTPEQRRLRDLALQQPQQEPQTFQFDQVGQALGRVPVPGLGVPLGDVGTQVFQPLGQAIGEAQGFLERNVFAPVRAVSSLPLAPISGELEKARRREAVFQQATKLPTLEEQASAFNNLRTQSEAQPTTFQTNVLQPWGTLLSDIRQGRGGSPADIATRVSEIGRAVPQGEAFFADLLNPLYWVPLPAGEGMRLTGAGLRAVAQKSERLATLAAKGAEDITGVPLRPSMRRAVAARPAGAAAMQPPDFVPAEVPPPVQAAPEQAVSRAAPAVAESSQFKPLSYTSSGVANLLQAPSGELIERVAIGTKKGWWKVVAGDTEYVAKTPEAVVDLAQRSVGRVEPPSPPVSARPLVSQEPRAPISPSAQQPVIPPQAAEAPTIPPEAAKAPVEAGLPAGAPPPTPPEKPPVATGGAGVEPPSYESARAKLMALVKAAKPVRAETEAMRTEARAQQAAIMHGVYGQTQGEAAFARARGALKGELPKAEFTPPQPSMTQPEVDSLFNRIQTFPSYQDKPFTIQSVQGALSDILKGKLPVQSELVHLEDVFGADFVKAIVESRKSMGRKAWDLLMQALNVPRTLLASTDISYTWRQGFFLSVGQQREWRAAMQAQFKALATEEGYAAEMEKIVSNPYYDSALSHRLDLTIHPGTRGLLGTEESYQGAGLAEKIPIIGKAVRMSERAAVGFINRLRMDTFASEAAKLGPDALSSDLDHLAQAINIVTGRGSLGKFEQAGPILNGIFFAPKNAASRFEIPYVVATKNPTLLKMGARNLVASIGTAVSLAALAKAAGAEVNLDTNSSDFGKIKIGNTRYDLFAGELQVAVLISRLISGVQTNIGTGTQRPVTPIEIVGQFLERKLAPPPAVALAWKTGKDVIGQKTTPGEIAFNALVPLTLQDILDAVHDQQNAVQVALSGALSTVGVGVQTFRTNGSVPARPFWENLPLFKSEAPPPPPRKPKGKKKPMILVPARR